MEAERRNSDDTIDRNGLLSTNNTTHGSVAVLLLQP